MRVRVKKGRIGYFGHKRRREGDVFDIRGHWKDEKTGEPRTDFSDRWMEEVSVAVPANTAPPQKKFGPGNPDDIPEDIPSEVTESPTEDVKVVAPEVGKVTEATVRKGPGRPKKAG